MSANNPFPKLDAAELDRLAQERGFSRKSKRNWLRRTPDFVQLINLQGSQWSSQDSYLDFGLWPLALGEPPTIAESKFHFRTRAEDMSVSDLASFFSRADGLTTLSELGAAYASGQVAGLVTKELRSLLR